MFANGSERNEQPQAILVLDWSISKYLLLWNYFAKMNRNLVGSVLKLLKAEWKDIFIFSPQGLPCQINLLLCKENVAL
jgi:hypothetical protein